MLKIIEIYQKTNELKKCKKKRGFFGKIFTTYIYDMSYTVFSTLN